MLRARRNAGLYVGVVAPREALRDTGVAPEGEGVDLHDVLRTPVTQAPAPRIELRDGRWRESAYAGEHSPNLAGPARKPRPQLGVKGRRLVAVGEEDEDGPRTERLRNREPRVHPLGNLATRRPRHAPVHRAHRRRDVAVVRAHFNWCEQEKGPMTGEQAQPELGAARERGRRIEHRRLGVLEPCEGVVRGRCVLDVHALADVEHDEVAIHGRGHRELRPPQRHRYQPHRQRQHREPGIEGEGAAPADLSRTHGRPS